MPSKGRVASPKASKPSIAISEIGELLRQETREALVERLQAIDERRGQPSKKRRK